MAWQLGRNFLIDVEAKQTAHVPEHALVIVEARILDDPAKPARVRGIATSGKRALSAAPLLFVLQ